MSFLNEQGLSRLWTHILAKLDSKVDKEIGKSLSTNDFTDEEKQKLSELQQSVQADWDETDSSKLAYILNKPENLVQINLEGYEQGTANLIDADTLGGISADDYALKEDLENFSSGSDWAQNDSGAKDYIKNRTHYVVTTEFACDQNLGSYSFEGRTIIKVQEYSIFEQNAAYNNHLISATFSDGSVGQFVTSTLSITGGGRGEEGEGADLNYIYSAPKNFTETLSSSLYIIPPNSTTDFNGIFITEDSNITNVKIQSFKVL